MKDRIILELMLERAELLGQPNSAEFWYHRAVNLRDRPSHFLLIGASGEGILTRPQYLRFA